MLFFKQNGERFRDFSSQFTRPKKDIWIRVLVHFHPNGGKEEKWEKGNGKEWNLQSEKTASRKKKYSS